MMTPVLLALRWAVTGLVEGRGGGPSAPPVTGDDVPRYRELRRRITVQIGADAHQRLVDQAALLPRAQVLDRALTALAAARG
jgi:hypothetical protein